MSLHIQEKSRYWKCDSCKEFHDAGRPVKKLIKSPNLKRCSPNKNGRRFKYAREAKNHVCLNLFNVTCPGVFNTKKP